MNSLSRRSFLAASAAILTPVAHAPGSPAANHSDSVIIPSLAPRVAAERFPHGVVNYVHDERDRHRGREIQHVDGTTAPHLSVDKFPAKGVARPATLVDRHNIGVAHQAQARRIRIAALDARHERTAARCRLEVLSIEP